MMKENKEISELKKKKFSDIKNMIYGRTAMITLGFLAQFAVFSLGYIWLRNYSFWMYVFFLTISIWAVIYIYNISDNPDMKLSWMLPLSIFPIFGAIFYVTIIMQPGSKVMHGRLKNLSQITRGNLTPHKKSRDKLRQISPHMGQLSHYLWMWDNSPVYENTQVTYFPVGDLQFPAMVEELKKAEKFIFMEFFIVCEGTMWSEIHRILREKAQAGVEVRFMYDGTDVLLNLPNYYDQILEDEGIQCKMFAPIKPIFSPHYNNRDHRKIMVVDGKVAFTGGINIADEYINVRHRFGHWKDTGLMLKGDAVERFTLMFLEMWNESVKKPEDFGKYVAGEKGVIPSDGFVMPYSVNPLGQERVGVRVYLDIINTAHTFIHIMTPYLVLDYQMIMALTYAAKRGVEVVIIMPHIPDKKTVFALGKTYYNELLEAGVKICEYGPGFVHAKVFVVDGEKAIVGTVNLDYRSLYHHFECGTILYRNSEIVKIEEDIQDALTKCYPQKVEDYKKLKLRDRFVGRIMRLIAPLM